MKIVSLFSGAGGLDLGFINAGHTVVWANDVIEDCVSTYRRNIGSHIHFGDISKVNIDEIPAADMVIGGFPCQGFSVANMSRDSKDPRNRLYLEYLRILRGKKPAFFLAENVKGIMSLEGGQVFKRIIKDFEACGYSIKHCVVNAADYGVPQTRQRVVIAGTRSGIDYDLQWPPRASHSRHRIPGFKQWISVGQALRDIPDPIDKHSLLNHVCSQYKLKHTGFINHRPVDPSKPAPTVTARGDMKGGAMINHHPNNKRRMSVREAAIVQSFPLEFEFVGAMTSCYLQVGNAVPPLLAQALAKNFPLSVPKRRKRVSKDSPREVLQLDLGWAI